MSLLVVVPLFRNRLCKAPRLRNEQRDHATWRLFLRGGTVGAANRCDGAGGDVFINSIWEPVRIIDLARAAWCIYAGLGKIGRASEGTMGDSKEVEPTPG